MVLSLNLLPNNITETVSNTNCPLNLQNFFRERERKKGMAKEETFLIFILLCDWSKLKLSRGPNCKTLAMYKLLELPENVIYTGGNLTEMANFTQDSFYLSLFKINGNSISEHPERSLHLKTERRKCVCFMCGYLIAIVTSEDACISRIKQHCWLSHDNSNC
jgi:hypothetical protein